MAGPSAAVLLREVLGSDGEARCRRMLHGLASQADGDSFWVSERPFIMWFGEEYEGELAEMVEDGLPDVLGWTPRDIVGLAAMCNADEDHNILGELCVRVAREWDGIIAFGGPILDPDTPPRGAPGKPTKVDNPSGLAGTLFITWYETANGVYATTQYGDVDLLESWRQRADFRMVK